MSGHRQGVSGAPRVERFTAINTTGRIVVVEDPDSHRKSPTLWVRVRNADATNPLEVYFTEDAFDVGANFVLLAPGEIVEGPFELSPPSSEAKATVNAGTGAIWLAAAAGTADVELLVVFR